MYISALLKATCMRLLCTINQSVLLSLMLVAWSEILPVVVRKSLSGTPHGSNFSSTVNSTEYGGLVCSFMSIIMIPPMSCDSVVNVVNLFDDTLRKVNPDVTHIASTAVRLGPDVCVAGRCFCDESENMMGGSTVRVLKIETLFGSDSLLLPFNIEFPYEFDTRNDDSAFIRMISL